MLSSPVSRGAGKVERSLTDLFQELVGSDHVLTVGDLVAHAFGGVPTRSQRISVLRAAHRLMKRARTQKRSAIWRWRVTERADGTLAFHDVSHPVRVWAIQIQPHGVVWGEAGIVSITAARVNVIYQGARASLDRVKLWFQVARWRGVFFVSDRNGFGARVFDEAWSRRYGQLYPDLLPLEAARLLLGVPPNYTREDIITAFRKLSKRYHPDAGGTAEEFHALIEARDRLLASIGSSAPAPTEPAFAPKGMRVVYRSEKAPRRPTRIAGGKRTAKHSLITLTNHGSG